MTRSFISTTAIERAISAANRRKKEKEREALIQSQQGNKKELPPVYSLLGVNFDINTRIAKIEISQTQQYRTVERYVTQNYVKYPIFSSWKTKSKQIKKTIKLTNKELERLNRHEDSLIRQFSEEIILAIGNEELYPSWFIKLALQEEYKANNTALDEELKNFAHPIGQKTEQCEKAIENCNSEIDKNNKEIACLEKKNKVVIKRIQKIENAKKSFFKSIFTLFIYNYYKSNRRKKKFQDRNFQYEKEIKDLKEKNDSNSTQIVELKNQINNMRRSLKKKCDEILKERELLSDKLNYDLDNVQSLSTEVGIDSTFILLKKFIGLEYEKIIGCYVIHNREKDKYYVGQSKDIMRRIKQHFKGTVPNNIIFAEDYYSSLSIDRDNLFEIKIIPCETKDELDRTEKKLIEEYDAFNSGYNGTSGNT